MSRTLLIIILSALVTQIPRTIPYFLSFTQKLPKRIRKCMLLLPLASLGALVFPGVVTDFGTQWYAGLSALLLSFLISFFKLPMIVSILLALVTSSLLLLI